MGCDDQIFSICPAGQKFFPCLDGLNGVMVNPVLPFGIQTLQGAVNQVPAQHSSLPMRGQVNGYVAGCMSRCWGQADIIVKGVVSIHRQNLPAFHDGQYTFLVSGCILLRRMRNFFPGDDVFCIGKRGYPATINQAGIPAAVITMQVGAKYIIDVYGIYSRRQQFAVPGIVGASMPVFKIVIGLVTADAGVDQNHVVRCANDPGLYGNDKHACFWTQSVGFKPVTLGLHQGQVYPRKGIGRRQEGDLHFQDTTDLDITNAELHVEGSNAIYLFDL